MSWDGHVTYFVHSHSLTVSAAASLCGVQEVISLTAVKQYS